jgi:orotate phosphoribosyltransferase-like protein
MEGTKSKKLIRKVEELYKQGNTSASIAKELKISKSKVGYILYSILRIHEQMPRKLPTSNLIDTMPKDLVNKIIRLYGWGYTAGEIAEDIELSYNRIRMLISEAKEKNLIKKFL